MLFEKQYTSKFTRVYTGQMLGCGYVVVRGRHAHALAVAYPRHRVGHPKSYGIAPRLAPSALTIFIGYLNTQCISAQSELINVHILCIFAF